MDLRRAIKKIKHLKLWAMIIYIYSKHLINALNNFTIFHDHLLFLATRVELFNPKVFLTVVADFAIQEFVCLH